MADNVVIPFTADTAPIDNAVKSLAALSEGFNNLNDTITEGAGNAVVQDLNQQLGKTAEKMDTVKTKTQQLSAQKKMLEEELAKVSAEFGEESAQAKKLESSILGVSTKMRQHTLEMRELTKAGSDTGRMMGFLTHSTMGAMQAFGALNMAMAGGEGNEKAEKAMMKSMEIMQLMAAATEIFTAKRELADAKKLIMTKLQTAADSENLVVKYAAIAAQTILNAVMAMNPLGIIITAVVAVGAAFMAWNNQTKSTVEILQNVIEENDKVSESLKFGREETDKLFESEKKLAKARGANNEDLHKMTLDNIKRQNAALTMEMGIAKQSLEAQIAINKEKLIDHVSFWGSVGTVFQTGFGLWGNMDDKQKEKVASNNAELDKLYKERQKTLNDLVAKHNALQAEFLDDKKDAVEEKKKVAEDEKKDAEDRKKKAADKLKAARQSANELKELEIANIKDAAQRAKEEAKEKAKEQIEGLEKDKNYNAKVLEIKKELAKKLAEVDNKISDDLKVKAEADIKAANEMKILMMKDSGASQEEILMAQEKEELRIAGDNELEKLKVMQKYDDMRLKLEEDTQAKIKAVQDKANADEKAALMKKLSDAKQIETQAFAFISSLQKGASDKKMGEYNEELNRIEDLHERKVITDKDYASQKKKVDDKMKEERKKAAEEEKKIRLLQATANLALGITKILAEGFKGDFGISDGILIGLDTAIGVANIAQIASTPAYAKGTKKAAKGWKLVGEEGPELINDAGGYPVITHKDTMDILKKYDIPALNNTMFPGLEAFHLNSDRMDEAIAGIVARGHGVNIDYDKLASKIGEHVGQNVKVANNKTVFNEDGFTEYLNSKGSNKIFRKGRND